ncbi:hypothetical protein DPMN_191606 [Dreissena polymorpha]|uniref:Uncharacterized protein n=1 Tax=Dreissena polymorpha TaxID=45954 RepID=A0A9D4B7M3_DREPO|nr:hypothetical protein DPMN_191606 [Dreissena polymorpha]
MFTVIPKPEIIDHARQPGEPVVEVIDNSGDKQVIKGWSEEPSQDDLTYKQLKKHRDALLEADLVNKKRLKDLEREKSELVKLYEPTYQENKALKSHITHGPEVAKIKQLQMEKKLLKEEVFRLSEDNKVLVEQMKDAMQKSKKVRDSIYDKAWRDALERASRRKEGKEKDVIRTNKKESENKDVLSEPEPIAEDELDKRLNEMEKKLKTVQDNLKRLKQEKKKIYAFQKNNHERKPTIIQDAVEAKLENDLDKFTTSIDEVEKKQTVLTTDISAAKEEAEKPKPDKTKSHLTITLKNELKSVEIQTDDVWDLVKKRKISHKSKLTQTKYDNHKSTQTEFPKREQATNTLARRLQYINDLNKMHTSTEKGSVIQIDQTSETSSGISSVKTIKTPSHWKQRQPISVTTPEHVKGNQYAKALVKHHVNDDGVSLNDSSSTIGVSKKASVNNKLMTKQTNEPKQRGQVTGINKDNTKGSHYIQEPKLMTTHMKELKQSGQVTDIHKDNTKGSRNRQIPKVSKEPLRQENEIEMALKTKSEKQSKVLSEYEDKIMVETINDAKLFTRAKAKHKDKTMSEFRDKIVDDTKLPRLHRAHGMVGLKNSNNRSMSLESLDKLRLNQSDTVNHRNKPGKSIARTIKVKASSTDGRFHPSSRKRDHFTENSIQSNVQDVKEKFGSSENINISGRLKTKLVDVENLNVHYRDESEYDAILDELKERYKQPLETVAPKSDSPTPKVRKNFVQPPAKVHMKDEEILKDPITHIATVNDTYYGMIDDDMAFTPIKFMTNARTVGMDSLKLFL